MELKLKEDTLIIVKNKNEFLSHINQNLINVKIMNQKELINNFYFSYDEKAIYYLMNQYKYTYDNSVLYLNNLYYINPNISNDKINHLKKIKQELIINNLLITNKLFKQYLEQKTIIFYNFGILDKYTQQIIKDLKRITKVEVYNEKSNNYNHQNVFEAITPNEEVTFIAQKICDLNKKGVSLNQVKLYNVPDNYIEIIKRVFKLYNIRINLNQTTLYMTKIGQEFLNNLSNNTRESLKYIQNKYNFSDSNIQNIYNQIITILNKYTWDNVDKLKPLIIESFKTTLVNQKEYLNEVKIINNLPSEDYVFIMAFNQGILPKHIKNEEYIEDTLKVKLNLNTSAELNKISYTNLTNQIKSTKNITISYSKYNNEELYISSLNEELKLKIEPITIHYNYSNIHNKLLLAQDIDNLVKYNEKSSDLSILYNTYPTIPYGTYNNQFSGISCDKLKKYLHNTLTLSYSSMNNYYNCAFKYYLSNILKINKFEDTFLIIIGKLFHYILSIAFTKEINLEYEYDKYLKRYSFNSKEKFFLDNLKKELLFIINTIKKQYQYSSLNQSLYEQKIEISKTKSDMIIIFKGFIDKLLLDDKHSLVAIIDYKTGNPQLNLNNIIYGLDMQLPVYTYLVQHLFPNIKIVGFYLQKILNNEIIKDNKHSYMYLKEKNLKLQGYSINNESLIKQLDSSYQNSVVISSMKLTKSGLSSTRTISEETIKKLQNLTENKMNECILNIENANFTINPKKLGTNVISCQYCEYKDICFKKEKDVQILKQYHNMEFLEEVD